MLERTRGIFIGPLKKFDNVREGRRQLTELFNPATAER